MTQGTLPYWKLKASDGARREAGMGVDAESVTEANDRLRREVKALRKELDFSKKPPPWSHATADCFSVYRVGESELHGFADV